LKLRSVRADVPAPAIAPVAAAVAAVAAVDADATTPASASAAAPATPAAPATAATPATAAPTRLRRCRRCADEDCRRADEVNEQQSQRCQAARQDIVAFSHSRISRSLPDTQNSGRRP